MRLRVWACWALFFSVGCGSTITSPPGQPPPTKADARQSFTDPKGRLTVTFPANPTQLQDTKAVGGNDQFQLGIWEARDGDTKYILTAGYGPEKLLDGKFDLDELAKGDGLKNPYWQTVNSRAVTSNGQPGRQVEFTATDGLRSSVSLFTRYKGTVVTMSVNGPAGVTGDSPEAKAFFASLQFKR